VNPMPSIPTMPPPAANAAIGLSGQRSARLVIEAECTTCGRVSDETSDGLSAVRLALAHTAATGHVVILNGTTDAPEVDEGTNSAVTGRQLPL